MIRQSLSKIIYLFVFTVIFVSFRFKTAGDPKVLTHPRHLAVLHQHIVKLTNSFYNLNAVAVIVRVFLPISVHMQL